MPEKTISEATVEAVWEEVAELPEAKALKEMNRINKAQPALVAYVMARTEGLSEDASELSVYLLLVVSRIFETHFGKLKKVDVKTVSALERVESSPGEDAQPVVMALLEDCIFDEDAEVELSDEEQDKIFSSLRVVVEALSSAA